MTDDPIHARIRAEAEDGIIFQSVFPPDYGSRSMTYFGGQPTLSPTLEWPRVSPSRPNTKTFRRDHPQQILQTNLPMMFLGQIYLRDLPNIEQRNFLPKCGVLHFFAYPGQDWDEANEDYGCVLYSPENAEFLSESPMPAGMPPCYGSGSEHMYRWLAHTRHDGYDFPRTFQHWAMKPVACPTFPNAYQLGYYGNDAGPWNWSWEFEQKAALEKTFGEPIANKRFPVPFGYRKLWTPDAKYPYAWIFIEVFAGELTHDLNYKMRRIRAGSDKVEDSESALALCQKIIEQSMNWVRLSRIQGRFEPVSPQMIAKFFSWMRSLEKEEKLLGKRLNTNTLNRITTTSLQIGVDLCLADNAQAAQLIPRLSIENNRFRHSVFEACHQMFGFGTSVQGAPERYRNSHQLLMQFDSDDGMNWLWGDCGVIQYWISNDDLRANRFDHVTMTLEGG